MHPTLNSSVDPLLRSSSPGQRDCLPPASCGRGEALEERSQGGDRVKMSRDEVLPKPDLGPRVEVIDSHLSGDHLPQKIQCTELVRAVLQVCKLPSDFHRFAQRSLKEFRNVEGPFEKRTDLWPCPLRVGGVGQPCTSFLQGGDDGFVSSRPELFACSSWSGMRVRRRTTPGLATR